MYMNACACRQISSLYVSGRISQGKDTYSKARDHTIKVKILTQRHVTILRRAVIDAYAGQMLCSAVHQIPSGSVYIDVYIMSNMCMCVCMRICRCVCVDIRT